MVWESYSEGMSMCVEECRVVLERALHNQGTDAFSVLMLLALLFVLNS